MQPRRPPRQRHTAAGWWSAGRVPHNGRAWQRIPHNAAAPRIPRGHIPATPRGSAGGGSADRSRAARGWRRCSCVRVGACGMCRGATGGMRATRRRCRLPRLRLLSSCPRLSSPPSPVLASNSRRRPSAPNCPRLRRPFSPGGPLLESEVPLTVATVLDRKWKSHQKLWAEVPKG